MSGSEHSIQYLRRIGLAVVGFAPGLPETLSLEGGYMMTDIIKQLVGQKLDRTCVSKKLRFDKHLYEQGHPGSPPADTPSMRGDGNCNAF